MSPDVDKHVRAHAQTHSFIEAEGKLLDSKRGEKKQPGVKNSTVDIK